MSNKRFSGLNTELKPHLIMFLLGVGLLAVYGFLYHQGILEAVSWESKANRMLGYFLGDLFTQQFPRIHLEFLILGCVGLGFVFLLRGRNKIVAASICGIAFVLWTTFAYYIPYRNYYERRWAIADYGSLHMKWIEDYIRFEGTADAEDALQKIKEREFSKDDLSNTQYIISAAMRAKTPRLFKVLLEKGLKPGDLSQYLTAAINKSEEYVKEVLVLYENAGLEKEYKFLDQAIRKGNPEIVRLLYDRGFRLEDEPGLNPLVLAKDYGITGVVEALLEDNRFSDEREKLGTHLDAKIHRAVKLESGHYLAIGTFNKFKGEKVPCEQTQQGIECGTMLNRPNEKVSEDQLRNCAAAAEYSKISPAFRMMCVIQLNKDGTWDRSWSGKPIPYPREFESQLKMFQMVPLPGSQQLAVLTDHTYPETVGAYVVKKNADGSLDKSFNEIRLRGGWSFYQLQGGDIFAISESAEVRRYDQNGNLKKGYPCTVANPSMNIMSWVRHQKDETFIAFRNYAKATRQTLVKVSGSCELDQEFNSNVAKLGITGFLGLRWAANNKIQLRVSDNIIGGVPLLGAAVLDESGNLVEDETQTVTNAITEFQKTKSQTCTAAKLSEKSGALAIEFRCGIDELEAVELSGLKMAD